MKIRSTILLATLVMGAAAQAQTAAPAAPKAPEPDFTLSYNAGLVTDYRYRGISQTRLLPAVQGGADFAHKNGLYLGAWGSTIKWIKDIPGGDAGVELDLYVGYKTEIAKGLTLAEALMAPTRIYVKSTMALIKAGKIKGLAHITGGGLIENPPRCIAEGLQAAFDWDAWPLPHVFQWLGETGGISDHELRRTFNCGIGFMLVVAPENAEAVLAGLLNAGEVAFICGQLETV
jgi:hypothetical protein